MKKRQKESIKFFEISNVYHKTKQYKFKKISINNYFGKKKLKL